MTRDNTTSLILVGLGIYLLWKYSSGGSTTVTVGPGTVVNPGGGTTPCQPTGQAPAGPCQSGQTWMWDSTQCAYVCTPLAL